MTRTLTAKSKRWIRRILFALVPLAVLWGAASLVLHLLEEKKVISTYRQDDVVTAPVYVTQVKSGDPEHLVFFNKYANVETLLTKKKTANSLRFFVLGESFAQGAPYTAMGPGRPQYGDITNWLKAILELRFPSKTIEAVNAGVSGINSFGVVEIVKDVLPLQPDFIVIVQGNNEGYLTPQINLELQKWIVYRALKKGLLREPNPAERPEFMQQQNKPAEVEQAYRDNYRRIVDLAAAQGVRVVLSTMPINLKFDGNSVPWNGSQWTPDEPMRKGDTLFRQGRYREALQSYQQSQVRFFKDLFVGNCLEALGEYDAAMKLYRDMAQREPWGRARPSFNDFFRRISREKSNVTLADAERAYLASDPHGMPNPKLFLDNCHMHWRGYLLVARAMAQTIVESRLVTGTPGEPLPEPTLEQMIEKYHWTFFTKPESEQVLPPPPIQ